MRKYRRLTREDRITIERMLEQGKKQIEIADKIDVHRSTVSREIKRNKAVKGPYKWRGAQSKAEVARPHRIDYPRKIEGPLEELVMQFLEARMSPDQISNRLKLESAKWSVSHETIYKWIYFIAPQFKRCLRWKSRTRQKRVGRHRRGLGKFPRKFIDMRPEAANTRSEVGHWERDLLIGKQSGSALLVLQDRKTRLILIRKVQSRQADEVNKVTANALKPYNVKTLTNDNGVEFGCYLDLEKALQSPIYYCHAYTSWERGTVENTNGLLRQFIPKGTDLSEWTDSAIQDLENLINTRPRKTLGYLSPEEIHNRKKIKLVRGEKFYKERAWIREKESFKAAMIREVGYYLEKVDRSNKRCLFVALNN